MKLLSEIPTRAKNRVSRFKRQTSKERGERRETEMEEREREGEGRDRERERKTERTCECIYDIELTNDGPKREQKV